MSVYVGEIKFFHIQVFKHYINNYINIWNEI